MKYFVLLFSIFILLFAACAPRQPATLTVLTHDSFAVSEAVVKAFEEANKVKLVFLPGGDAGAMLNKAILSKEAPLADVLFGVDNTFLSRALEAGIFGRISRLPCKKFPPALNSIRRTAPCRLTTAMCASTMTRHISRITTFPCRDRSKT
jgi:thiamine transport system substrate-binding protein